MNDKQREVYEFMLEFQSRFKKPPLMREIAEALGLNWRSTVRYCIAALRKLGLVEIVMPSGYRRRYRAVKDE